MKIPQKGSANIILIALVVILASALGYVVLKEKIESTSLATTIVTSPVLGSSVSQGNSLDISWKSSGFLTTTSVALFLVNAQTETSIGVISNSQPRTGSYKWYVPLPNSGTCYDCGLYKVPVGKYKIVAKIYTPSKAWFPGSNAINAGNLPTPTYLTTSESGVFDVVAPDTTAVPYISSLSSTYGPAGTKVVISGSGFFTGVAGGGPIIDFRNKNNGDYALVASLSTNSTYVVPSMVSNGVSGVQTTPGTYDLQVENIYGKSNTVVFTVTQ